MRREPCTIVFACAVHRPIAMTPCWEPVIEDVRRAHGMFPCLWAIDRTIAAGLASITPIQRAALSYHPHIVFTEYTRLDEPARTVPELAALARWGVRVLPHETVRDVFLRAVQRAQPGWTWDTVETLFAQNFGER